jgi:hypothetical protein
MQRFWLQKGLVLIERPESGLRTYRVTERGSQAAGALQAPEQVVEVARDIVRTVRAQSFRELVSGIYRKYPEMRANSVFR